MIGFLLTVGPREGDISVDVVESILRFYPTAKIWIRDDATSDGTYEKLQGLAAAHPARIDLVRNPTPMGYYGIPVSIFRSFARIAKAPEKLEMLIQLDPDVWIREGIVEFAQKKFDREGPGIIGSYMIAPTLARRKHGDSRNSILRDLLPLGWDKASRKVRAGLPFYLKYLSPAFKSGYRLGHHVLAAFYIMHGDTLYALQKAGFWESMPDAGSRDVKADDPLVSMGAYIVGHKLIELHDEDKPRVWIQYQSPVPLSAAQILAARYLAVHPLKYDEAALKLRNELRLGLGA